MRKITHGPCRRRFELRKSTVIEIGLSFGADEPRHEEAVYAAQFGEVARQGPDFAALVDQFRQAAQLAGINRQPLDRRPGIQQMVDPLLDRKSVV